MQSVNRSLLTLTEVFMLLYWLFATLVALKLITVSAELMYPDHTDPTIVAWNWSFLPIDLLFALCGLASRFLGLSSSTKQTLSVFSLSLMFCAGLMALTFCVIVGFYDAFWWDTNLWLVLLPVFVAASTFACSERVDSHG